MGVTTGSILNSRTARATSKASSGVKPNALVQTRVTLANRSRVSGRASYTSLSRSVNGFVRPVIVGHGGCCKNSNSTMSTMEKIAMWNAITQSTLQLTQSIASMVTAGKSASTDAVAKAPKQTQIQTQTKTTDLGTLSSLAGTQVSKNAGVDNSILSTLESLGFENISLDNIDYEQMAKDMLSELNGATNSAELYKAIGKAKTYKIQISANLTKDIGAMKTELAKFNGATDPENSISLAEDAVTNAEQEYNTAQKAVPQQKRSVDVQRDNYESKMECLAQDKEKYEAAKNALTTATGNYDDAAKKLSDARTNYSQAKIATRECQNSFDVASANLTQAQANLDALLAQQSTTEVDTVLQAQIAEARDKVNVATQAKNDAEAALKKAQLDEKAKKEDLEGDNGAEKAFEKAKGDLADARKGVDTLASELKEAGKITDAEYEALKKAEVDLTKGEETLATCEKTVADKKDALTEAQDKVADLTRKRDQLANQIGDLEEMQKASKLLDNLDSYETKLNKMLKNEGKTVEDLNADLLDPKNKAKEGEIRQKRSDIMANSAVNAINHDKQVVANNSFNATRQISEALNSLQMTGSLGLSQTINGHQVSFNKATNTYTVDGGEPVDRSTAFSQVSQKPTV